MAKLSILLSIIVLSYQTLTIEAKAIDGSKTLVTRAAEFLDKHLLHNGELENVLQSNKKHDHQDVEFPVLCLNELNNLDSDILLSILELAAIDIVEYLKYALTESTFTYPTLILHSNMDRVGKGGVKSNIDAEYIKARNQDEDEYSDEDCDEDSEEEYIKERNQEEEEGLEEDIKARNQEENEELEEEDIKTRNQGESEEDIKARNQDENEELEDEDVKTRNQEESGEDIKARNQEENEESKEDIKARNQEENEKPEGEDIRARNQEEESKDDVKPNKQKESKKEKNVQTTNQEEEIKTRQLKQEKKQTQGKTTSDTPDELNILLSNVSVSLVEGLHTFLRGLQRTAKNFKEQS